MQHSHHRGTPEGARVLGLVKTWCLDIFCSIDDIQVQAQKEIQKPVHTTTY